MKLALREIDPWTFRTACLVGGGPTLLAVARLRAESLAIPRPSAVCSPRLPPS